MRTMFALFLIAFLFPACTTGNSPREMLSNGNFDAGLQDWDINDDGSFSVVSGAARLGVANSRRDYQDIQFYYNHGLRFTAGKQYELSFTARSPGGRSIRVQVAKSLVAPFPLMLDRVIVLAAAPVRFSFNFTADSDTTLAGLVFQFGNDAADFYLDDVSLIEN